MTTTKQQILNAALQLFNKNGIDAITTRDIAKKIKISPGNLTYHFPAKNDIIHAICKKFIDEVDEELKPKAEITHKNTLLLYYNQVKTIFETQVKYKFIFDKRYGEILTSLPEMQQHYQKVQKERHGMWKQLNEQLVKEKLATPLLVEDAYAHNYMLNMLALFWHQEAAIYLPGLSDKDKTEHALAVFFQSYKPYLTKKGLAELMPLLKKLERY